MRTLLIPTLFVALSSLAHCQQQQLHETARTHRRASSLLTTKPPSSHECNCPKVTCPKLSCPPPAAATPCSTSFLLETPEGPRLFRLKSKQESAPSPKRAISPHLQSRTHLPVAQPGSASPSRWHKLQNTHLNRRPRPLNFASTALPIATSRASASSLQPFPPIHTGGSSRELKTIRTLFRALTSTLSPTTSTAPTTTQAPTTRSPTTTTLPPTLPTEAPITERITPDPFDSTTKLSLGVAIREHKILRKLQRTIASPQPVIPSAIQTTPSKSTTNTTTITVPATSITTPTDAPITARPITNVIAALPTQVPVTETKEPIASESKKSPNEQPLPAEFLDDFAVLNHLPHAQAPPVTIAPQTPFKSSRDSFQPSLGNFRTAQEPRVHVKPARDSFAPSSSTQQQVLINSTPISRSFTEAAFESEEQELTTTAKIETTTTSEFVPFTNFPTEETTIDVAPEPDSSELLNVQEFADRMPDVFAQKKIKVDESKCNDREFLEIIVKNIEADSPSRSKKMITEVLGNRAASVLCTEENLSFRLVADRYCQVEAGTIICMVFQI